MRLHECTTESSNREKAVSDAMVDLQIKENKVKLTLFLKKMKMSKIYVVWRAW